MNRRKRMAERQRKATRMTVGLEDHDYQKLGQIALSTDASVFWVIRQAIRQFIENSSEGRYPLSMSHTPIKDGKA